MKKYGKKPTITEYIKNLRVEKDYNELDFFH